jgi:putative tricarboxylic transport membrane protein
MDKSAIRSALPYFVGLVVAGLLYHYAQQIEYTPRAGALGPDFWPKVAIALMAAMCVFEIVRIFTGLKSETHGVTDALEEGHPETAEAPPQKYPWLLAAGIVLVTVYAFVVDTLGFLLSTFLFLSAFMYLGRYRNHAAIWGTSTVITLAAALIFMRFAYVSLPRGTPPFDAFTDFIRVMVGG